MPESTMAKCFRQQAYTSKRVSRSGCLCVGPRRSLSLSSSLSLSLSLSLFISLSLSLFLGPVLSKSRHVREPGALCVRPRRSLSGAVSEPGGISGCGGLYVGPRRSPPRSESGPGALCGRLRRSLCRGPALSLSRPGAFGRLLYGGPAISLYVGILSQRSLCRAPAVSASVVGACILSVRAWRFPAVIASGPGALCRSKLSGGFCVGAQRSLCRGPASPCVGARRGPALFCWAASVSGPGALCLCRRPAQSMSRPAFSPSGPGAFRRSLCLGPALSTLGRRGLPRAPNSDPRTLIPPASMRVPHPEPRAPSSVP